MIDWSLKHTNRKVFDYYCGLVNMRRNHPAFRMSSTDDIRKNLEFIDTGMPGVVAFLLKHNANGDSWKNILVIYNAGRHPVTVDIPQKNWTLVLNENGFKKNGYRIVNAARVNVPAVSAIVLAEIVAGQN
jgi:pullulanase